MSRQLWRLPDDRATLAMIRSTSVEPHIATALDIGPVDAIRSRPCIELLCSTTRGRNRIPDVGLRFALVYCNSLDFVLGSNRVNRGFVGNAKALSTSVDHDDMGDDRHLRGWDLL